MTATPIDATWRRRHPLPAIGDGLDKEARGRVLIVGGSAFVPGALLLTADAALRAGAGKVQLATIAPAALALGVALPEAAVIALETDDGEIARGAADTLERFVANCDTLVLGPGMSCGEGTPALVAAVLAGVAGTVVLDAGALTAVRDRADVVRALAGRAVLTPHPGELATLTGCDKAAIEADPARAACDAADAFGAVVVLKSAETHVAAPGGVLLHFVSDAAGLGTAGSGDVLAGVIGGLLARGAEPVCAAAWGVWLHGTAGSAAAARIGPVGFRASELAAEIPALMAAQSLR